MASSIEKIKKLVRSVLMSCKEGVPENRFLGDYKSLTSCQLKPEKYGFKGVRELLQSMPDVARVSYCYGVTTFHAVQNKETAHIQSLVSKQNSKKKKKSKSKKITSFKCRPVKSYYKPNHVRYINPLMAPKPMCQPTQSLPKLLELSVGKPGHAPRKTSTRAISKSTTMTQHDRQRGTVSQLGSAPNINPVIINRIKTVLASRPNGVVSNALSGIYRCEHGVDLPESILLGLECEQIKNVARIDKRCLGNREYITFFPIDLGAPANQKTKNELAADISETEIRKLQKVASQRTTEGRNESNTLDSKISRVTTAQPGALEKGSKMDFDFQKRSSTESSLKQCSNEDNKAKFLKYPAVPLNSSNQGKVSNPQELCMEPNSLHYGTITHTPSGMLFFVKVSAYDNLLEKLSSVSIEKRKLTHPVIPGSYVMDHNERGEVLSLSDSHAEVYYLDLGRIRKVDIAELTDMPSQLLEVPRLAVHCKLHGVCLEDDKVQDASVKLFQKYMDSEVILDVISTKSEHVGDKLACVHYVQCYIRQSKYLNKELIEIVKKSPVTGNCSENLTGLNASSSASSIYCESSDDDSSSIPVYSNVEAEDLSNDENCAYSDISSHQQETTPWPITESLDENTLAGGDNVYSVNSKNKLLNTTDMLVNLPKIPGYRGQFGQIMKVIVTRIVTTNQFYMLPIKRLPRLKNITAEMIKHFPDNSASLSISKPTAGDKKLYAAICKTDSLPIWRRVEVTHIVKDYACVYLVDLGQVDYVPLDSLIRLPKHIALEPKLAVVGRLGGIMTKSSQEFEASKHFRNVAIGQVLVAHAVDCSLVKNSFVFDVSLLYPDDKNCYKCINDVMVEHWNVSEYI